MQDLFYIFTTEMRVYLQSELLGLAIAKALGKMGKTQRAAAKELNVTQGAISNLLAGRFETKNALVTRVCKYANVDPNRFRVPYAQPGDLDREAVAALARACGGQKRKTEAVIRVLRALETLTPAS